MKNQPALNILVPLIAVLALITAGAGLFWQDRTSSYLFTSLRGQAVQIYGQGLYSHDSTFFAGSFKGADVITFFVAVPLLLFSFFLYRRSSLTGGILLVSLLSYFLYTAASMAFGAAYNPLFLVYIAYFSAGLFAFVLAFTSLDLPALAAHFQGRRPRRGMAAFLFVAGLVVLVLWLSDALPGQTPQVLGSYTTIITYPLDMGVIAPSAILAGVLVLRRAPLGYLLGAILLILNALTGLVVFSQTVVQLSLGIPFSTPQLIGMVGSWIVMALFAVGLTILYFRDLSDSVFVQAAGALKG
jgi:hypothetical protein